MKIDPKLKISSSRNFGIVFFALFLIIGLWPILNDENIRLWSIFISLVFLILALFKSKILSPLNILWSKLGIFLGLIVAPLVMCLIFFLVVTPIGFLMRLIGKDILNLKYNKNINTYWINRDKGNSSMKRQF